MTNEQETGGMGNDAELLDLVKSWKAKRAAQAPPAQAQPQQRQPTLADLGMTREEILKMVKEEVQEAQASASEEAIAYTQSVLKNFEKTMNTPKSNLGMGEPFRMGRRITKTEEAPGPSGQ